MEENRGYCPVGIQQSFREDEAWPLCVTKRPGYLKQFDDFFED